MAYLTTKAGEESNTHGVLKVGLGQTIFNFAIKDPGISGANLRNSSDSVRRNII